MTLQEIIDTVLLKYPHSYSNTDVIGIVNRVQKELFRTIYNAQTATQYDLIADNPFYPITYSPQRIIEVVINDEEYGLVNIRDKAPCKFYYVSEANTIGIFPTPTEDVIGGLVIFHYMVPKTLTLSDLGTEPDFDSDWHMILVYRVCKEIAEDSRDSDMVNGFITQIDGLVNEYNLSATLEPTVIEGRW